MKKRNTKEVYREEIKAAFLAGFRIGSRDEALSRLSEKQADSLEKYVDSRILEFQQQEGTVDIELRGKFITLIEALENVMIVQGRNINKTVLQQLKEELQ